MPPHLQCRTVDEVSIYNVTQRQNYQDYVMRLLLLQHTENM